MQDVQTPAPRVSDLLRRGKLYDLNRERSTGQVDKGSTT